MLSVNPEPVSMRLGMYIMTPEPISAAFHQSHQSVGLYMYPTYRCQAGSVKPIPPFVPRQPVGKHVPGATNTHISRTNF
jgi:hypothetical protein